MKPLKPSMKEKRRYILVVGKIDDVEKAIFDFIGILGFSKARIVWIKKEKNLGIFSVNRDSLNHVRASFAVWPEEIRVKRVSGTLRGLKKRI